MTKPITNDYPSFLVPRPPMPTDPAVLADFDALYERALAAGPAATVDYDLPQPRWQFLCHVADTRPVLLHGSGNPGIEVFEPRKPDDVSEFGARKAVFAASDGLWPMYFAILDRDRYPMSLINSAVRLDVDGRSSEPLYFFSIDREALRQRPFRSGTIYVLPRRTFEQQAPMVLAGRRIHLAHWASPEPVVPLMRLTIEPADFPLLEQIRGHDTETTFARARADPDGFPWLDED